MYVYAAASRTATAVRRGLEGKCEAVGWTPVVSALSLVCASELW